MEVKLVVVEGKGEGREIPLPASQFIIGRSSRCHLRPHSEQVSKVHCAIGRKAGNRVVVRDMKSRNKTYINGMPITGTVMVKDGDILGIGPLQFRFAIDTETPAQPLHEEHVLWLMDGGADAFDVESSSDTTVINLPPDLMNENEREESATRLSSPKSEHGLSAGKYLREQVLPYIAERWNSQPPEIGLIGISMGGQGALQLAYRFPREFPVVAAISPAVDFHNWHGQGLPIDEMFPTREAARQQTVTLQLHPLNWPKHQLLVCDPGDVEWFEGVERLAMKLSSSGIPFESDMETKAGGHCWEYFNSMAPRVISFVADRLGMRNERRVMSDEKKHLTPDS